MQNAKCKIGIYLTVTTHYVILSEAALCAAKSKTAPAGAYLPPGGRWIFRFAPWKGKTEKTDEERRNLQVQKKPDMVRKP